jgi:hypothetical protein
VTNTQNKQLKIENEEIFFIGWATDFTHFSTAFFGMSLDVLAVSFSAFSRRSRRRTPPRHHQRLSLRHSHCLHHLKYQLIFNDNTQTNELLAWKASRDCRTFLHKGNQCDY